MYRTVAAVSLLAVGVAACGSSSKPLSSVSLANKSGCTEIRAASAPIYSTEASACKIGDHDVTAIAFKDNAARDKWRDAAGSVIGTGPIVVGDRFVITSDSEDTAAAIAPRVGGEVPGAPATSTPSAAPPYVPPTEPPGPAAFVAGFRSLSPFGTLDVSSVGDDSALIGLGNSVCDGLSSGVSYGHAIEVLTATKYHPSADDAAKLVKLSVDNLCPTNKDQLPGT